MEEYGHSKYSSHRLAEFTYSISVTYAFIGCLGFFLNIIIIIVLVKNCVFHNVTNIYVLVLALSDIIICAFNVPLQAYYDTTEKVGFGTVACKILFPSLGIPLYVSCLTILLIAIDRYRIIIYPLKERITNCYAIISVVVVVTFSTISIIPVAVFTYSVYAKNESLISAKDYSYCTEYWPNKTIRICYTFLTFACLYFLPLTVTAYLYFRIYCRLKMRSFKRSDNARKHRTNKILIAIVLCFAVFWSPWSVYALYLEWIAFFNDLRWLQNYLHANSTAEFYLAQESRHIKLTEVTLKCFATVSSVVNPFLYGWLNDSIKEVICRLFRRVSLQGMKSRKPTSVRNNQYLFGKFEERNQRESKVEFLKIEGKCDDLSTMQSRNDGRFLTTGITPSIFDASTKRTSLNPSSLIRFPSQENSNIREENSLMPTVNLDYMRKRESMRESRQLRKIDTIESSDKSVTPEETDVFIAMAVVVKQQMFDRNRRRSMMTETKKKTFDRKTSLM